MEGLHGAEGSRLEGAQREGVGYERGKSLEDIPRPFAVAVELIPLRNLRALYNLLQYNKDIKPLYRNGDHRSTEGYLTTSQILLLRERAYREKEQTRFARAGRPPGVSNKTANHKLVKMAYGKLNG